MDFHIIMGFNRPFMVDIYTEYFRQHNIILHPIMRDNIVDWPKEKWIQPIISPVRPITILDGLYFKFNYFIETQQINDNDYYMFLCDDDSIEGDVFDEIKKMNDDVIFISMRRGHNINYERPSNTWHGTNTFYAKPEFVLACNISLQQFIVKGRVLKEVRFRDHNWADGYMCEYLKEHYSSVYREDLFSLFNYYEPGRYNNPDNLVTGIVVSYNTKELLQTAINSIRKFHPVIKIIVVDNSDKKNSCYLYVKKLATTDKNIKAIQTEKNIGHGRGLVEGIKHVKTPYMLIFDSDIIMRKTCIQNMIDMMETDTYGVGWIQENDIGGHLYKTRKNMNMYGSMKYLHPFFCMIQLSEYYKYPPFVHHGSPAVNTMYAIHKKGLSNQTIKSFDNIFEKYITHDFEGTRKFAGIGGGAVWDFADGDIDVQNKNIKQKAEEVITGITVSHNTKELLETAINSIRKFHPNMKLIIIDGSNETDECYKYICSLPDKNTRVFHLLENIGHGKGLCVGIEHVKTPYMLIFDSDIEMLKSPIQEMLDIVEDNTYGVGYIEKTAFDGHEWGSKPIHKNQGSIKYLHPYFCLIQKKEYEKYEPFIHHGAPAVNTMLDIYNKGLSNIVIKEFNGLGHSSGKGWTWEGKPREFIKHDTRGTRAVRTKKRQPEIEGTWDKVIPVMEIKSTRPFIINNGEITIITCTGDRPLAFSLCQKWIEQQTIKPDQWIIVDDGKIPINIPNLPFVNYIRREPLSSDPEHTMIINIGKAFEYILGKKIFFIEDDEYYAPIYLNQMSKLLNKYEVVGIGRSRYYHLFNGTYHIHNNMGHASLAETCFRSSFLPEVNNILSGDSFFDIRIWDIVNTGLTNFQETGLSEFISKDKRGYIFDDKENYLYVGMKGLPGRTGIGAGHRGSGTKDINHNILNKWIRSNDIKLYLDLLENKDNIINIPLILNHITNKTRHHTIQQPFNNSPWRANVVPINNSGIIKNHLQSCPVKR